MKGIFLCRKWAGVICCMGIILVCLFHTVWQSRAENTMASLRDTVIVLDAGHGGWDPGRTGTSGANEKELNLLVTEKLAEYLEKGGAKVILTRSADEALGSGKKADMAERKRIINESGGDILVSIHQNAFPSAKAKGAQVFYHAGSEKGKLLAECLQENLRNRIDGSNQRQAKENSTYYILRTTEMPAVIVECGFLSNSEEEKLLNDRDYQQKLAWAIYSGILDYFEKISII